MQHEIKARYPVAASVVMKMFCDKDFHTRKLDALGLTKYQVLDHKETPSEFRIKIQRKVPMAPPGIIAKLVPAEATVTSEEVWDRKAGGRVKVEPAGIPVEITCKATMRDVGAECVVSYLWEIQAKVPFIGGALEKFVASDMEKKLAEEAKAAITLLGPYR